MSQSEGNDPTVVVERRSGGSGVGMFVLGALVGAGLALLFAPQSGEETRADLRRGARRLRRKARLAVEDVEERAEDLMRRGRGAAREAAREAREALERRLARHARPDEDAEDGGT